MADKPWDYSGKQLRPRCRRRRFIVMIAAFVCLLAAICGGTYSYFSGKDKVVNQLHTSGMDFEIEEPSWKDPNVPVRPGDVLPKDPQIVNTGQTDFVVRVKLREVWTPKKPGAVSVLPDNPDYIRFFAANTGGQGTEGAFTAQQLLDILRADQQRDEAGKNFSLRRGLIPNRSNPNKDYWRADIPAGWYRGSLQDSEWLYYNQIVPSAGRTAPVFQAVTIRTAEDIWPLDAVIPETGETLEEAHARVRAEYDRMLMQYDLDIYVYAETVQADAFSWQDAWGDDLPAGWQTQWGGVS